MSFFEDGAEAGVARAEAAQNKAMFKQMQKDGLDPWDDIEQIHADGLAEKRAWKAQAKAAKKAGQPVPRKPYQDNFW
jgi:hypothetical protein